jgi:hypothetical protein
MRINRTYIGLLSFLAMIAIAVSNISFDIWNSIQINEPLWNVYGILSVCTQWGIPLLISLMGILYLSTDVPFSTNTVYKKLFPPAAVACVFWWVINALIYQRTNFATELDWDTFLECMGTVLYEPYNMFLLQLFTMLIAFYPLLIRIVRDRKLLLYAVIATFTISMFVPMLEFIPYVRYINLFANQINWNFFTSYGFYVFFGIWILKTEFQWHYRIVAYCSGIFSTVVMLSLTKIVSCVSVDVDTRFVGLNSPFIAFQVLAIIVLVKQIFNNYSNNKLIRAVFPLFCKNIYGFIALYSIINGIVTQKFGENIVFVSLISVLITNIVSVLLRRLPLTSFLLCENNLWGTGYEN